MAQQVVSSVVRAVRSNRKFTPQRAAIKLVRANVSSCYMYNYIPELTIIRIFNIGINVLSSDKILICCHGDLFILRRHHQLLRRLEIYYHQTEIQ